MLKIKLTNEMLRLISQIDENRFSARAAVLPVMTANKLRKNSKKKSAYSSNRIEGNPLTEDQANFAIESDPHRHFLKPEQEIRNYFMALEFLEQCLHEKVDFTKELILKVQAMVEKGASKEKIGLRRAMPPGVLFAVYDSESGNAEYIPPMYSEVPELLDELVQYVSTTDDHPLLVAAVVHYQLVTIHPFEDGNGRTARLMSGYILDKTGYGFGGIGSLEEYFAYDSQEYYRSLQMGLPALYYEGRHDPPHPEIWIHYFLRMVALYSKRVCELSSQSSNEDIYAALSHISAKDRTFLKTIIQGHFYEFTPIGIAKTLGISNKTVIYRSKSLCEAGFLLPVLAKERIRSYKLSEWARNKEKQILDALNQ